MIHKVSPPRSSTFSGVDQSSEFHYFSPIHCTNFSQSPFCTNIHRLFTAYNQINSTFFIMAQLLFAIYWAIHYNFFHQPLHKYPSSAFSRCIENFDSKHFTSISDDSSFSVLRFPPHFAYRPNSDRVIGIRPPGVLPQGTIRTTGWSWVGTSPVAPPSPACPPTRPLALPPPSSSCFLLNLGLKSKLPYGVATPYFWVCRAFHIFFAPCSLSLTQLLLLAYSRI